MADTSTDAERLDREREGLDTTLSDIHAKLSEMESDKAESRAASILAGLGFSEEWQHFATNKDLFWRLEDEACSGESSFLRAGFTAA